MEYPFDPTSLFLVGILPSPRDLEIAKLLGWYRIPIRFAPKIIEVDYLAFYQTSAFGENHRWQIENVAEVHGHELITRAELFRDEADHPRAKEEYYKIQIGPLIQLGHPIVAGSWKRLTFLYSTGEKILKAKTLTDLATTYDERELLWRSLREKAAQNTGYTTKGLPEFPIDPTLLALLGDITVIKEKKDYDEIE